MIHCFSDNESLACFLRSFPSAERFFAAFSLDPNSFRFDETNQSCFAADSDGALTGVFVFDRYEDERLFEMRRWLSNSETACRGMFDHLKAHYPSFQAEFTFKPKDSLLKSLLTEYGAKIFPEQQNMKLGSPPSGMDAEGVELLSEPYREQYFALHRSKDDAYWTGEMIAVEPETFHVLIAVANGRVVGYLDFTHCDETNNVADLYVSERERGKGYGARLLAKALEMNAPKGMTLQVDTDNVPALRLYEKMGFEKVEGENFIDARWEIG